MGLIKQNFTFNHKMLKQPITHASLVFLGFGDHPCGYFCPPLPAHAGMYRVGVKETSNGYLQHYVYLTYGEGGETWVRDINTLEQLNNIHKGFCDADLFTINNY